MLKVAWILSAVCITGLVACGGPKGTVPPFVAKHVGTPEARGVTISLDEQGVVKRWAVKMDKRGMPDWIFHSADRHLGPGEDVGYHVAEYTDGDKTFEISRRKPNGLVAELAVRDDHTVRHIERELATDEIPEMILTRISLEQSFAPSSFQVRDIADGDILYAEFYHVTGRDGGKDVELLLTPDGMMLGRCRKIDTQMTLVSSR